MLVKSNPFIMAVLASFFFAFSTFISKLLGQGLVGEPMHPFQIAHARFTFGLVGASLLLLYWNKNFSRPNLKLHLLRCFLGWLGVSILFTGVIYIPAADAVALSFMNPIFAMIFAIYILNEKVDSFLWIAVGCSFIGALILIRPEGNQFNFVAFLCLIGAAAFGLEIVITKLISTTENIVQILFINNFIGAGLATIPLYYFAKSPTTLQLFFFATVGFTMVIGQALFLTAIRTSQASVVTPYIYSTIIFIVLLDWIILQINPGMWSIVGASFIICAGVYIAFKTDQKTKKLVKIRNYKS